MHARIEDLRKGDVVLVALGNNLAELKILRQPCLAKRGNKVNWYGVPRWTSVLCACREETITGTSTGGRPWKITKSVVADGKDYTRERRIDFTFKTCWIIKREI
jgi:hypothetical protein